MHNKCGLVVFPLVALCIVALVARPSGKLASGATLPLPTVINTWQRAPGSVSGVPGRSQVEFHLYIPGQTQQLLLWNLANNQQECDPVNVWAHDERYSDIVGDIDGDGKLEIVAPDGKRMRCFRLEGSGLVELWSTAPGAENVGSPALYDVNGDGRQDVIYGFGNGTVVVQDAIDGTVFLRRHLGPGGILASPLISDVDNDGHQEIVLCTFSDPSKIYVLSSNGDTKWSSVCSGGYLRSRKVQGSPIALDADGDGHMEVVVATWGGDINYFDGVDGSSEGFVHATSTFASPVAADLDGDGYLEVVIAGSAGKIVILDRNKTKKTFTHSGQNGRADPLVADVNSDGYPDVVTVDTQLHVFDKSGEIYTYYETGFESWRSAPVFYNSGYDRDGDLDLLFFMFRQGTPPVAKLFFLDSQTASLSEQWLLPKHDYRRSGIYHSDLWGNDPDIALLGYNGTWGNVSQGSSVQRVFTLRNTGTATLTGSISSTGKIAAINVTSFSIPPGGQIGVRYSLDTSDQGDLSAYLTITSNDPDEPKLCLKQSAFIVRPEHDIAVYAIHVAGQLNPNYVNVPPIKVECKNVGSFAEYNVSVNLTIDSESCPNLSRATFDLLPGQAFNVTFLWDRSKPSISGEGTFTLKAALRNANFSLEADTANNVMTKTVEVSYPIVVESVSTWLRVNMSYLTASNDFTEGDVMNLRIVLSNKWSNPITLVPVVNIEDVTGAPVQAYSYIGYELTLPPGDEVTIWPGWYLGLEIDSPTMYNATVYAFDSLGGGVKVLADPFVHTFWVKPAP